MRTVAFSAVFLATGIASALAADPTGDWRVADGCRQHQGCRMQRHMWGAVAWEKTPGGRDKNNPDVSKQSRPTLGMPILIAMKKKPAVDQWEGQVYNAKDGQMYATTIKPVGTDQMEIQGCVLGFLCGGETWTRVPARSPQARPTAWPRVPPKGRRAPKTAAQQPTRPAAPKTTGARQPGAPKAAVRSRRPASPAIIGDICLLPDIARFAH